MIDSTSAILKWVLTQRAFTNQVWITLWHYGSESNLVNAPLCDEILNLLKSHLQDYIFVHICMLGHASAQMGTGCYHRPQGEKKIMRLNRGEQNSIV